MASLNIHASGLARKITLSVRLKGFRAFNVRVWIAAQVFRIGAAIAGTNIEFMDGDEKEKA